MKFKFIFFCMFMSGVYAGGSGNFSQTTSETAPGKEDTHKQTTGFLGRASQAAMAEGSKNEKSVTTPSFDTNTQSTTQRDNTSDSTGKSKSSINDKEMQEIQEKVLRKRDIKFNAENRDKEYQKLVKRELDKRKEYLRKGHSKRGYQDRSSPKKRHEAARRLLEIFHGPKIANAAHLS